MYQVLIADDEKTVRDSLKESIKWKEFDLEVAEIAHNGYEAVGIAQSRQIDIAILDIRMPGIDGLRLCSMMKEHNPEIQLIIISGYAEFEYAKKAIEYGVLGYCLKPLDYAEVSRYLLQAVRHLQQKRGQNPGELLEASMESDMETVSAILESYGFTGDSCYVAVGVGERAVSIHSEEGIVIGLGGGVWAYVLKQKIRPEQMKMMALRGNFRGLGYLEDAVPYAELFQALEQCSAMAYQYFIDPACRICKELNEEEAGALLEEVQSCIHEKRWEELCGRLLDIKDCSLGAFTIRSALKLCNMVYMSELFQSSTEDYYVYGFRQLIVQYPSFGEMVDEIYASVKDAKHTVGGEVISGNKSFLKLLEYVNQNYRGNITLQTAGQALHINPNYVSQLFKKEAQVTFVQYITQKRLEDAKQLLTTTQMSIEEIAMSVGFKDYFYFLRTFKRIVGLSPGKYRLRG